ncbi:hypothetical protein [Calorimonas adulescens]|uniref:ATP-binding protein n=1 Tax=Calorimonas adulescens TaxID=2606906 RepID=A0A5D8Q9R4_9THEO|nr:hypothetical protein [Calorimonas adulescens]TZE81320.1 hypothetical protein FWJ32_09820 [Calorimonas adulescens]
MDYKRLTVITGHFGSGKTEISINYAIELKKLVDKVALVDLDIVNPYFRSREERETLKQDYDVRVVCTEEEYMNADIPALSPEIYGVLQDKRWNTVVDLGGDDIGATALGMFNKYFQEEPYEMIFVVNVNRPFTSTKEGIIKRIRAIEKASRIKVTHLVNNTHLMDDTTIDDILNGYKVTEEVSRETGLPIKFISGKKEILEKLPDYIEVKLFPLNLFMKPPWK